MTITAESNSILIFDNAVFSFSCFKKGYKHIDLFPLTASYKDVLLVKESLDAQGRPANILDSAGLIEQQTLAYREKFIDWAGAIGNFNIGSIPVYKWMLLSDKGVSAWWFGLLSDKDTAKSQPFFKIARTAAILTQIEDTSCKIVFLALKDTAFQKQLEEILNKHGVNCTIIRTRLSGKGLTTRFRKFLRSINSLRMAQTLCKIFLMVGYLRLIMPPLKKRRMAFNDALLFFTYFPSLIEQEGQPVKFRNKFAGPLQGLCEACDKDIVWALNYAEFDNYTFKKAVKLAKKFIENNEQMFFWQEFIRLKAVFIAVFEYARLISIWRYLKKRLNEGIIDGITGNNFAGIFFIEALEESMRGSYYLNGILQYVTFKDMLSRISGFSRAVYSCEMMGWEYAFIAGSRAAGNNFPIIGFQDFAFSLFHLQMFHSKGEIKLKGELGGIPLPESIAACGKIPQSMLEKYYDNTSNLETLRFSYMQKQLSIEDTARGYKKDKFVLLVCTNIDLNESKAIFNLVRDAYPRIEEGLEIWLKSHHSLTAEDIFKEAGGYFDKSLYLIKQGHISDFLAKSDAVLVGSSSAAIEAFAFSPQVLVYLNPENLNLSPLTAINDNYRKIYHPASLRKAVDDMRYHKQPEFSKERKDFIRSYWNLEPSLSEWKNVLNLNE